MSRVLVALHRQHELPCPTNASSHPSFGISTSSPRPLTQISATVSRMTTLDKYAHAQPRSGELGAPAEIRAALKQPTPPPARTAWKPWWPAYPSYGRQPLQTLITGVTVLPNRPGRSPSPPLTGATPTIAVVLDRTTVRIFSQRDPGRESTTASAGTSRSRARLNRRDLAGPATEITVVPCDISSEVHEESRIIWINGAFRIGKTKAARLLVRRIPDARIFNPEEVGYLLGT